MRGYDNTSYGAGFADVYDEWYAEVTDVDATVARVVDLAGEGGRVIELGVGTGRLALPMAAAGLAVSGIDASEAMLDRLRARDPDCRVTTIRGDMARDLPAGPFDVALVAYNTLFNLPDAAAQGACFAAVASCLRPGGCFVVEAFVPATTGEWVERPTVELRSMTVDRVVLSVARHDPVMQEASGQFVDLSEEGGVQLRPWRIRWSTPAQLDEMATAAGFELEARWADMAATPFDDASNDHVSVYRR
ncbi:MAG: methyltransferase domain-containing protein [Ilumatobacter sp.]|nr:methyltransferase domain-containing protein [Ilumatobacter sp.]